MDDFLYQTFSFTPASLLFGLLLVFGRGGGGSDIFGFCLLLVLISPLPLAFIQQRGQNNLFIPLTGWAILVGTLSWTLIRTITPANLLGGRPARVVRIVLVTLLIALWRRDRNWRAGFSVDAVTEQQRADLGRDPTIAQPTCEAPSADPGAADA